MKRRISAFAIGAAVPVAIFVIWWVLSSGSKSPFYPPLEQIVITFKHDWLFANVGTDLVPSLYRIGAGFGVSAVIGVLLGLLIGISQALRTTVEPTLEFIRAIPAAAVLPVFIVVLGVSDTQKISFIAFGAVWPILINTIEGVRGTDAAYLEMARGYGVTRTQRLFRVIIPAATPQIFAGMRIALSIAVLLVVYAEMFASTNGVGFFTINAQTLFEIPDMWSGIFVLAILSYVVNVLFLAIERRALGWHRGWRASQLD